MDISDWIEGLGSARIVERREAAERLAQLGPAPRAAAIPLVRACGDEDPQVREWATSALEDMGPCDLEEMDSLVQLLESADADVGYWAATLLGRSEDAAAPAVPKLVAVMQSPREKSVRHRCAWALGMIGPTARSAELALRDAASSGDPRLARLANQALERILS